MAGSSPSGQVFYGRMLPVLPGFLAGSFRPTRFSMAGSCQACQVFYGRILPVLPYFLWQDAASRGRFSQLCYFDTILNNMLKEVMFYNINLEFGVGLTVGTEVGI